MTKLQLQEENSKLNIEAGSLRQECDQLGSKDEEIRLEFAKAFNWQKEGAFRNTRDEYLTPSWGQILVKVGGLLNKSGVLKLQDKVDDLRSEVARVGDMVHEMHMTPEMKAQLR